MMAARSSFLSPTLDELLAGLAATPADVAQLPVTGLSVDSRTVRRGDLFLARRGLRADAATFLPDVARAGAVAALIDAGSEQTPPWPLPVVRVESLQRVAGVIAHRFYGCPTQHMRVVGVTGTNGKTSVSHYIAQALSTSVACGIIGTLGSGRLDALDASRHTTPDVLVVHETLAAMHREGVEHVAIEASSHGLDQGRLAGVEFDVAVFTNLTRDHLDYHGNRNRYGEAKRLLFHTPGLAAAVVNLDDPFGAALASGLPDDVRVLSYGLRAQAAADLSGRIVERDTGGLVIAVSGRYGNADLRVPLLGAFNAENVLAALGALLALGMPFERALRRLACCRAPAGRMQIVPGNTGAPLVLVDYAHTPDALRGALQAAREHCRGRLFCVFGCGGERDTGKRGPMGRVAELLADELVITDDNPRTESGDAIVADILGGLHVPARVRIERDRGAAINGAIHRAREGDVVLVAGKGHETVQDIGGQRRPFSDVAAARAALGNDSGD